MSMNRRLQAYYTKQANFMEANLVEATRTFDEISLLVNLHRLPSGLLPAERQRFSPIRSDLDLFTRAQPLMYHLMGELSTLGIRLREVMQWRRSRALGLSSQPAEEAQPVQSVPEQGFKARLKSIPGAVANLVSPGPIEQAEQVPVEDPFDSMPLTYRSGCRMTKWFGSGMAELYAEKMRTILSTRVPVLLRDIQTYTNELLMETGDQVAVIAK